MCNFRVLILCGLIGLYSDFLSTTDIPTTFQCHYLCLVQFGDLNNAVQMLEDMTQRLEHPYGGESLVCILGVIERAKIIALGLEGNGRYRKRRGCFGQLGDQHGKTPESSSTPTHR